METSPVGLMIERKASKKQLPVGTSKVGGKPSVSKDFVWPMHTDADAPLGFVCQINLEELQKTAPSTVLPKDGLLQFYCSLEETDLSSPNPPHTIVLIESTKGLVEAPFPRGINTTEADFGERLITFSPEEVDGAYMLGEVPEFNDSMLNEAYHSEKSIVHLLDLDAYTYVARKKGNGSIFGEGFFTFLIKDTDLKKGKFDTAMLVFEGGS